MDVWIVSCPDYPRPTTHVFWSEEAAWELMVQYADAEAWFPSLYVGTVERAKF